MSSESRRTERSSSFSTTSSADYTTTSPSPSSSDGSDRRAGGVAGGGHYRGITFDDILPPHMITNAPPSPDAADGKGKQKQKQKRGHSKAASASFSSSSSAGERPSRHSLPASMTPTATAAATDEQLRTPPSKRNYPSGKKLSIGGSGGKSRMRATARALVRGLSVVKMKRDSRGRGGYEAV